MRKFTFWAIAVLITLASAVYQRMTGPTYPFRGKVNIDGSDIKYGLPRSAENVKDCEISLKIQNPDTSGFVTYKRYKTDDPWIQVPLTRKAGLLVASLPKQPAAAKLAYKVVLRAREKEVSLAGESPVVIRFKGVVPAAVLIPHILAMFLAMLFSTRAGLAALDQSSNPRTYVLWTIALVFIGGFILGPIVQKLSFGAFWTGFPLGLDLTDNKMLIACVGWLAALIAGQRGKPARGWVLGASILMLVVYFIPHSLLGSELKYPAP